jgi:hypothetical protein
MKDRPRYVERETARRLTALFLSIGMSPVERIPVLGRDGPDISINESKLVIDVKSRGKIPSFCMKAEGIIQIGPLVGVRLRDLLKIADLPTSEDRGFTKQVLEWWAKLEFWKQQNYPAGITTIILHKPRVDILDATVVFHHLDLQIVKEVL